MSAGYYSWKSRRARLIEEAERLGVSSVGSNNQIANRVHDVRQEALDRALPCRECGGEGGREDRFRCDSCVARRRREVAAERERHVREREARLAVKEARAKLSSTQRWVVEHDDFSSVSELRLAALGEVE